MGAGAAHATWTESHRGHHLGKAAMGGARQQGPPALPRGGLLEKLNSSRRLGRSRTVRNGWPCYHLHFEARAQSLRVSRRCFVLAHDEYSLNIC